VTGYDDILDVYRSHIERPGSWNNLYERPALKKLLPPLRGRDVLDLGCASGHYTDYALSQGARVTAVDIARGWIQRLEARPPDPALRVVRADISRPMPFLASDGYDCIIASLVLHYLEDWETALAEMHRVLRPGGRAVVSTHHPCLTHKLHPADDLRDVFEVEETWARDSRQPFPVRFWVRSLAGTLRPFLQSAFHVVDVLEPPPDEAIEADDPALYRRLKAEPSFLFIVLEK
jgi:SAM-dependent methyltransferase